MPSLKFFGIILKRGKINKISCFLFYIFYKRKESGCILLFIAGILFIYFVIPLLESALSFLITWLKYKEAQYTAETYKISKKAEKEANAEERTHVIGFAYEDIEEEEIPEEEDDDENDS